ncbi:hypothetical protein DFQ29_001558 [Apophysomyces sp. BC1021]|nr:hypothetical protein DFQ29_001558 [Apophysomyces sp. BC1021]
MEEMAQKLTDKVQAIRDLREKLNSMKLNGGKNQDDEQNIPLAASLVVKAYLTGCREETRCVLFDEGYTSYSQLREKIQDIFRLKSNNFELKCSDSEVGFKEISTSDQYKEAIKSSFDLEPFDIPINVMKIHIQKDIDSDDSETESLSGTKDNGENSISEKKGVVDNDISMPDSPVVSINSDAKWDRVEKEDTHPLDIYALEALPLGNHEQPAFGSYHWTICNWESLDGRMLSETFSIGEL